MTVLNDETLSLDDVSIDEIRTTVEKLCSIENKIAGLEAEKIAVRYLKEQLTERGLTDIKEEKFEVHCWKPLSCLLRVIEPVQKEINAVIFPYSLSAKVKGPLFHFQNTSPEIHESKNEMIGITTWGSNLYLDPMKAYFNALDQGAKAVIIASPIEGDLHKIVVISSGELLKIPAINVTKEDGDFLFSLIKRGNVHVEIEVDVEYSEKIESQNLIASINSTEDSKEEIIVGAHTDAWFKGAAENSVPNAIILELARLLQEYIQNGQSLKRNIRFILFGAQESGSKDFYYWCNGSKAYVNNHPENLENIVAIFTMDSIGFPPPVKNLIGVTSDLFEFIRSVKTDVGGIDIEYYEPPGYESDHWFFEISGVPSVYCVADDSDLYHTQKDDQEHLDYNAIRFYAEFLKESLLYLATSEVIPVNLFRPLSTFQEILSSQTKWNGSPFDLSQLLSKINKILNLRKQFERETSRIVEKGTSDEKNALNRLLFSASRMINQTIGWIWRKSPPDDTRYLARMEMIEDYMDLNAAIRAIRSMPISNVGPHSEVKLNKQIENPYNWIRVHEPLSLLEEERSRIFQEIESEIAKLTKILDDISKGISAILERK
ncbi:MAG: M28 family peptidase [Candidatus Sifarchaeia archaeon]